MNKIYQDIYNAVALMEIVDTHEHLPGSVDLIEENTDILREYLSHYFSVDLISSGLSAKDFELVRDPSRPLMDRWRLVEEYWENARYTGYGRAIDRTVKGLYGIEAINGSTIEEANELFLKAREGNPYEYVLKEKSNIATCLADNWSEESDSRYFTQVYRLDQFLSIRSLGDLEKLAEPMGMTISSFKDWLDLAEYKLEEFISKGIKIFKIGAAYERPIYYKRADYHSAESDFNRIFDLTHYRDGMDSPSLILSDDFQGYMMHHLLGIINKHGLAVQFHTGLLEGNGNILSNSNPSLLNNLFLLYKDIKFDLFHISYPYQREAIALAKMFPNVFLDMCWAHIISPNSSIEFLREALDAVAYNKISAFGGDYLMVDTVYGHQIMARENVSYVLAEKVKDGVFSTDKAIEIARMLFYDNPVNIFNLDLNK